MDLRRITLPQLMVIVVILGVAAALAIPSIIIGLENRTAEKAAEHYASAMASADTYFPNQERSHTWQIIVPPGFTADIWVGDIDGVSKIHIQAPILIETRTVIDSLAAVEAGFKLVD